MNVFDFLAHQLVHVRCLRCRKNAGVWKETLSGNGFWENHHANRCRCDPPPSLPEGEELDRLVEQAWLRIDPTGAKQWTIAASKKYNGRAPVTTSR